MCCLIFLLFVTNVITSLKDIDVCLCSAVNQEFSLDAVGFVLYE